MKQLLVIMLTAIAGSSFIIPVAPAINGAWHAGKGTVEEVLIFQDNYFSCSIFDKANKKFIRSFGGTFRVTGNEAAAVIEFDTQDKQEVGKTRRFSFSIKDNSLQLDAGTGTTEWQRLDAGDGALAGNWRISGRLQNGQISPMQRGDRKTLKLLSGTRFQWMAINPATKEFHGTGGGHYTFVNGKYTEHIEFFPRDSTRVGASLQFEGAVANDVWTHKGLNSKGEPLHEEWRREQ